MCFHLSAEPVCEICRNQNRDRTTLCVVSDSRDVIALEKTREYGGKYHVLGGVISPMEGIGQINCIFNHWYGELASKKLKK